MKLLVEVLAVFYILTRTDYVSATSSVKTKSITQKFNNFDKDDKRTWKMRYFVNEKYFKDGGPMFIYIGGEYPIEAGYIASGLLVDIAAEHNGILFFPEHRGYGQSKLGSSLSMDILQLITIHQALADLANFIETQRNTDSRLANSKVILSGCSYAGSLAVWFNRKYPQLVDGTWGLSPPILAKVEFPEYLEITGKAMRELGSPQCYDRIKKGMEELQAMFSGERAKDAYDMLKLCDYFNYTKIEDVWTLFRAIQHLFATLVTKQRLEKEHIPIACDFLMKRPDDLSAVVDYFAQHYISSNKSCKSLNYDGTVFYHNNTSYDNMVSRQWMYQICNEFGWFQGSTSTKQPFGTLSPVTLDLKHCEDIFGPDFTEKRIREKVANTNKEFGGLNPKVKNLFMTHGGLDPWSALGPAESEISSVVPLYSHCAHLDGITSSNSPEMVASKERLLAKVREWLK